MSQDFIKVLLVEDDEEDYMITQDLLSEITQTRYKLDWASSFENGIKAIEENAYDIYLIDYRLGREEGLEVINNISSEKKQTPFILLTGQSDSTLDQIAMEAGAADFLDKSNLSPSLVDRAIRYAIKHKQALLALKKEQENAKMFLDMAGNIILVVNQDEKISLINREGVELLGYSEEKELIGINWFEHFIPENIRPDVKSVFDNLIHHKLKNVEHYENEIVDKHGNKRLIKWYNRLLFDEAGEPTGTISSGIDITEQRKAEAQLSQYATDLEKRVAERTSELAQNEIKLKKALEKEKELGELKSRFVAMASHEFRTPLSSILSSAELIGKYPNGDQQPKRERHINRISSSVQNLTAILNNFLSLEKLESDKIRYTAKKIDLNKFIAELLEEINLITHSEQAIELQINGSPEIETDPHLLKNILINLLSNAIKYSPNNKNVQLLIDHKTDQTSIQVIDQGIGIPAADQKHMFSRFFRATNANTIKGTGLGLTIVKRYLDLMGGSISFLSKEGKGTTFTVVLPNIN